MEENFKKRLQELKNTSSNGNLSHQPWSNFSEWKSCYDFLFINSYSKAGVKIKKIEDNLDAFINNLNLENLLVANNLLNIWKIRNENVNLVLTTSLLLEEIIKMKNDSDEKSYNNCATNNSNLNENYSFLHEDQKHILSQKIIRVTNLLIDDLKKKKRSLSSNMFLVAKEIDFPEFIVEIRHACTHKNLPQLETLKFVVKYLFFWIKENIWDMQYELFKLSEDVSMKFSDLISEIKLLKITKSKNKKTEIKKFEAKFSELETLITEQPGIEVKLEIDNLFLIVENLITTMFDKISIKNNIPECENLKEFSKVYKLLQFLEGKVIVILFFKFLSSQIFHFVKDLLLTNNESNINSSIQEKESILQTITFLANFAHKNDIISEEFKKDDFRYLIRSIYKNLNFAKDFSLYIYEVFSYFNIVVKDGKDFSKDLGVNNNLILTDYLKDLKNIEEIIHVNAGKDKEENAEGGDIERDEKFILEYPTGTLIFKQLDYLMKDGGAPDDFYKKEKGIKEGDFKSNEEDHMIIDGEENKFEFDEDDFYNREIESFLII